MHKHESLTPIFIGGTGRSGTTILSQFIGSHENAVKIPVESRFIIDKNGLIDLYEALANNYSIDQGRMAIKAFEDKVFKQMLNSYKAPYLGWNRDGSVDSFNMKNATKTLISKLALGTYEGIDFQSSDKLEYLYLLRRALHPLNRILGKVSHLTNKPRFTVLDNSINSKKSKDKLYIPKYFKEEDELLQHLKAFTLDTFKNILEQKKNTRAWCEDTPGNIMNLDFLQKLFPNGKYIHVMRHPVGVVHSMGNMIWAPNSLKQRCDLLTELYKRLIDIHQKHKFYNNYLFVKLEDLTFEPKKKELSSFLELDPTNYSGEIIIDPKKMNYYLDKMKKSDIEYASDRLRFAIDFFNY
jgi:hypothetical protein